MKNPKKIAIAAVLAGALALTGCSVGGNAASTSAKIDDSSSSLISIDVANMDFGYTDRDKDASYDAETATRIDLQGRSASVNGSGASVEGDEVTIDDEGTYLVSGTLNGQIVVNAEDQDKVQIVLADASIANDDGPAIEIQNADKVFVTLAENTKSTLADSSAYALSEGEDEPNATLYSKADLTINGTGTLEIDASYMHAVNSKGDLVITGGSFDIESMEDALRGKDCVKILDGSFTLATGGDGIKSSNDSDATRGFVSIDGGWFDIDAGDDGVQAATYLRLAGGDASIEAGDDALQSDIEAAMLAGSYKTVSQGKGVKAETVFTMDGGTLDIDTENEGIEAEKVIVNDGTIDIVAADDGINASAADSSSNASASASDTAAQPQGDMQQPPSDMQEPPDGMRGQRPDAGSDMSGRQGRIFVPDGTSDGNGAQMQDRQGMQGGPGGGDEAVNENCLIQVNGGTIRITAGGDCLDSNGYLEVTGGKVYALAWGAGNEAIDSNGTANVADGTVIMQGSQTQGPGMRG